MRESSIEAGFQFRSYKVDRFNFFSKLDLDLLRREEGFSSDEWDIKFRFRQPLHFVKINTYVGGIDMLVSILDKEVDHGDGVIANEENSLVRLDAGIAGVFASKDVLDPKTEDVLVKIQIPALLMPYLRGAVSTFLANSGFGPLIFPLINIHAIADKGLQDTEIKRIDKSSE